MILLNDALVLAILVAALVVVGLVLLFKLR